MSETNDTTRRGKTLSLKKTETSTVKQSFSHGRTKAVVVEKKRARVAPAATPAPNEATPAPKPKPEQPASQAPRQGSAGRPSQQGGGPKPIAGGRGGVVLRQLTEEEKVARSRAIVDARIAEEETRRRAEEERKRREAEEAQLQAEREAAAKRKAEEEARRAAEEDAKRRAEEELARHEKKAADEARPAPAPSPSANNAPQGRPAQARPAQGRPAPAKPGEGRPATARPGAPVAEAPAAAPAGAGAGVRARRPDAEEDDDGKGAKKVPGKSGAAPKVPAARKGPDDRRRGKLTVTKALSDDDERTRSVAAFRRHLQRVNKGQQQLAAGPAGPREVTIPETITVAELANRMARRAVDVIKVLMKNGMMLTVNDSIDADTAELVATEYGHTVKRVAESDVLEGLKGADDAAETLEPRPPVVTVMGHVDHGKTSLLDALRKTNVVSGEAGGITQHIGAYQVTRPSGQKITFLDTPGHAAFTAMRARGAKVTDIVVLVVAADDGVMPQTVEAISHAKAAGVPLIVAINKIDKPDAKPERVKTELLQYNIQVEDLGGDTQAIAVSALKRIGLDALEEAILLQAELLDLKANPHRSAEGAVVEAKLDKGRGAVATVLVERGTLKTGDILVAGSEWGRVRALINDRGEHVVSAGPSVPVEVLGLSGVPEAGDEFVVVDSEARAREVTEYRTRKRRESRQASNTRLTLDQLLKSKSEGETKYLPLVVKADVQGSIEAIQGALEKLGTNEVAVQFLQTGVGAITESDVILAQASGGAIIGFNVRANAHARERAKRDGVEIRYYNIIYNVVDDVKAVLSGMLAPEVREKFLGNAEILEVFNISKVGKVAGCRVTEGIVRRGAKVRLVRDSVVIHEGDLSTLKRFKDEVKEVQTGQECGMSFANYDNIAKGDVIECYEVETIQRAL